LFHYAAFSFPLAGKLLHNEIANRKCLSAWPRHEPDLMPDGMGIV